MANLNVVKLQSIRNCLKNVLIPIKDTDLTFEANVALSKVENKLTQSNKDWVETNKKFERKDGENKVIKYKILYTNRELGHYEYVRDEDNQLVVAKNDEDWASFVDKTEEYFREQEAYLTYEYEVNLKPFKLEKVKAAFKSKVLDGVDLSPLIGVLIDDSIEEE